MSFIRHQRLFLLILLLAVFNVLIGCEDDDDAGSSSEQPQDDDNNDNDSGDDDNDDGDDDNDSGDDDNDSGDDDNDSGDDDNDSSDDDSIDDDDDSESPFNGMSWSITTLYETSNTAYDPVLGVGSDGVVHIVYLDHAAHLIHLKKTGSEWQQNLLNDQESLGQPSLAIENPGIPRLAYSVGDAMVYGIENESSYSESTIPGVHCDYYALAVDILGNAYLACASDDSSFLRLVTNGSGEWQEEEIYPQTGIYQMAIRLDQDANTHLAFVSFENSGVTPYSSAYYVHNVNGNWIGGVIGGNRCWVFKSIDLAVSPDQLLHFSYSVGECELGSVFVSYDGQRIVYDFPTNFRVGSSMNLDGAGTPYIGFFLGNDTQLNIATITDGHVYTGIIDDSLGPYRKPSLAVDSEGYIHVAYTFLADLRYATNRP
ncbi:MAG: hypothetical protein GX444_09975 [Myxococcales bacterium]|nr:hypothetical protein [Myxococcales bacterium]